MVFRKKINPELDAPTHSARTYRHLCTPCETLVSRLPLRSPVWRTPMANKDKGGKSSKKVAEKTLKEKRLAKKAKKAQHTNESFDNTFGH